MEVDQEPFWMVYGYAQEAPRMRHRTFEDARREAERLARCNPGIRFYVLQTVGRAEKQDVDYRQIPFDQIPF